jgi:hypothetical protein
MSKEPFSLQLFARFSTRPCVLVRVAQNGFEGREDHRTPCASVCLEPDDITVVKPTAAMRRWMISDWPVSVLMGTAAASVNGGGIRRSTLLAILPLPCLTRAAYFEH